jgi:hypothetical protein
MQGISSRILKHVCSLLCGGVCENRLGNDTVVVQRVVRCSRDSQKQALLQALDGALHGVAVVQEVL